RFTANGAIFGAAAFPNRRCATFPVTTGPASGKGSADADGTINPKTAMLSRIWRLTGLIKFLRGDVVSKGSGSWKEKSRKFLLKEGRLPSRHVYATAAQAVVPWCTILW
ncbi:MAG: hypothetical protein DME33_10785, partial [Verrucomicrobia bacterium]